MKRRWMWAVTWGFLAGVGACRCGQETLDDLRPSVAVQPSPIEFGLRRVGVDSALVVKVLNRGTADLTVRSVRVEPATAPFRAEIPGNPASVLIIPEGQAVLQVVFHPARRGLEQAVLVVESDDPDHGRLEVAIQGEGGPPRIQVRPETLNFDLVHQGVGQTRTLEVQNTGLDTLHVSRVYLDPTSNPGFVLPADTFGSGDIPVNDVVLIRVDMRPALTGAATGTLHILSDADGAADKTVPLVATSNLAPRVSVVEALSRQADYRAPDLYVTVTLDASMTVDPEGDPFSLAWSITERPQGSQVFLQPVTDPMQRTLYLDTVGVYRVKVTATDSRGAVGTGEAVVRAIRDLALRLTWEPAANASCRSAATPEYQCGKTDVDLHLVAPTGTVGDYFSGCDLAPGCSATCTPRASCRGRGLDCAYANRNPDWGVLGDSADDPRLDIDDALGYGPENISVNGPPAGDYAIQVHFCNDRLTDEGAVARVEVFFHGDPAPVPVLGPVVLPNASTVNPARGGSLWLAGRVHYDPNATPKFTLTDFNANPILVEAPVDLCRR